MKFFPTLKGVHSLTESVDKCSAVLYGVITAIVNRTKGAARVCFHFLTRILADTKLIGERKLK